MRQDRPQLRFARRAAGLTIYIYGIINSYYTLCHPLHFFLCSLQNGQALLPNISAWREQQATAHDPLGIRHRTMVVVTIDVVAPPRRHGFGGPAGAEDGKGQDEEHRQDCAVPGARDEVHVVTEDAGAVVAEVELGKEAGDDPAEDDARLAGVVRDVAGVLDELREVDLAEGDALDPGDEL